MIEQNKTRLDLWIHVRKADISCKIDDVHALVRGQHVLEVSGAHLQGRNVALNTTPFYSFSSGTAMLYMLNEIH